MGRLTWFKAGGPFLFSTYGESKCYDLSMGGYLRRWWGSCLEHSLPSIERMVAAHEGKHKDLVKFIAHQTCISPGHISKLVRVLKLKDEISVNADFPEEPQPTILHEALGAPDPVALATQAIEEEWTAKEVRQEVSKQKEAATKKSLPKTEQYHLIVADPPWQYEHSISDSRDIENQYPTMDTTATELKLRAERKLGVMLKETARKQGQRDETFHDERFEIPSLEDQGISHTQSHRWQKVADVSEERFQVFINDTTAKTLSVSPRTIQDWTSRIDKDAKALRNQRIFERWLACWTEAEIAKEENIGEQTVRDVLSTKTADLPKPLKVLADFADADFHIPIYNIWRRQEKTPDS